MYRGRGAWGVDCGSMRWKGLASVGIACAVLCGASAAVLGVAAAGAKPPGPAFGEMIPIRVRPATGTPSTTFVVSFVAPAAAGDVNGLRRWYVVSARGPGKTNVTCTNAVTRLVSSARAHTRVRVLLSGSIAGGWCLGTFHGTVEEWFRPICVAGRACPQFIGFEILGTFKFTVQRAVSKTSA
jgi:hypothetical protein